MKKLNLHRLESYFINSHQTIFTTRDVMVVFDVEKRAADTFLFNNVKKGAIIRLKAGLFVLPNHMPSQFEIANRLVIPSYISLDTALSYYNLIPETVYAVTSITSKATKIFEVKDIGYQYQKIKDLAFTGYELKNISAENVYIADPEKSVADFLYFIFLGKRLYNDRLDLRKVNFKKVKEYLSLFGNRNIIKFANKIYKTYA